WPRRLGRGGDFQRSQRHTFEAPPVPADERVAGAVLVFHDEAVHRSEELGQLLTIAGGEVRPQDARIVVAKEVLLVSAGLPRDEDLPEVPENLDGLRRRVDQDAEVQTDLAAPAS